ncbi:MAG: tRNA (cytidine(34)-2'-O)-methyltransferase [Hyphomicrobiaceae bacterium]|nr:tRNA (cytidine(34)-2'-O)-methyltransferase [Hyphomicrobiaceae bacterium]MCC0010381.1 tRNA (cytidine(34)-2'-O)-methyltransferase [Hyphomicrobiaceae bacterium]
MRIALYQPDIPGNTGTILRMAACFKVAVDVIGPAGFDMTDRRLRRSGMDYLDHVELTRHIDFASFDAWRVSQGLRLVLVTAHASASYIDHAFADNDVLLLGRESAGVPDTVHEKVEARIAIPIQPDLRSLNVAIAAAMVLGEALRQTGGFSTRPGPMKAAPTEL